MLPHTRFRFVHTNLIARDWRALAAFYCTAFGCVMLDPVRDFRGRLLDAATGLSDAHLTGAHLRLPGWGHSGPTLEIFNYEHMLGRLPAALNRPGFGHIAFEVDDVAAALDDVLSAGGGRVGDVVTLETADGRGVTWCYAADPEGNVVELQSWDG